MTAEAAETKGGLFDFDSLPIPAAQSALLERRADAAAVSESGLKRSLALEVGIDDLQSALQMRHLGSLLCSLRKDGPPESQAAGQISEPEAILLLHRRADVNMQYGDIKRRPLHRAAECGFWRLVEELIKARADPNKADLAGEVPLHAAQTGWCGASHRDRRLAIEALVDGKAEVDFANSRGRTALHLAATSSSECVDLLIALEANVNAADLGGFTPLMWAAGRGNQIAVEALLKAEADATCQANRGQTALLFARTNGATEVCQMLETHLMLLDQGTRLAGDSAEESASRTRTQPYMGQIRREFAPDLSSNAY